MRELYLLLNLKAGVFLKSIADRRARNIFKNLSSSLIFGSVAIGVFLFSRAATGYLLQQQHIGLFLFHRFLSMLLYVFFITVNLGNMIVCYATLYKSEEVGFLMGLPVSHDKIFVIKFIDNFFYSSSTLFLLGLALLLGYGSYFAMPWHFYLLTLFVVLLPFMLIAGTMAVIALMLLIKVASRIGIRWLLACASVVYFVAVYAYFTITNPVHLVQEVMRHYPDVNAYFGYLDPPFVTILPNHWVSEFLYWTISGLPATAWKNIAALLGVLALVGTGAWLLARSQYYASWLLASEARFVPKAGIRRFRFRMMEFGRRAVFEPQTDALVRRDFWLFFREPSQWLHLSLMLMLLVVFLTAMSSLDVVSAQPFLRTISYLVVFLFDGFLIASIALRFVFPAMSLEGDAFWSVRSAPIDPQKVYWLKFTTSFLPVLIVAELLAVLSTSMLRDAPVVMAVGAVCTAFMVLALTGINLGAGTYFASFREKNPIRIASSQGASLTFLGSMVYLACVVLILLSPLTRYFELAMIHGPKSASPLALPVVAVGVLSLLVFVGSTALGLTTVKRDFSYTTS